MFEFWYWARAGQRLGPFSPAVVRRMAAAGALAADDAVAPVSGSAGWAAAGAVPGLVGTFAPLDRPDAPDGLVGCPGCRARLSPDAPACPGCGHPQPVGEWSAGRLRVARCVYCLATNAVATPGGVFRGGPCRGCGRPLAACHPQEFFEREMDELFRPAAWVRAVAGGAAGVVAFAAAGGVLYLVLGWLTGGVLYLVLGWLTGGAVVGWAAVFLGLLTGLLAGHTTAFAAGRRYGEWLRRRPGVPEFGLIDWEWADTRYGTYRGERERTRLAARAAGRPAYPRWAVPLAAVLLVAGGWYAYRAEFSDYARGRKAGVAHVREVNMKGAFLRAGMNAANLLDLIETNPKESPDWNAGFRAGFKEELARMYPEAKR